MVVSRRLVAVSSTALISSSTSPSTWKWLVLPLAGRTRPSSCKVSVMSASTRRATSAAWAPSASVLPSGTVTSTMLMASTSRHSSSGNFKTAPLLASPVPKPGTAPRAPSLSNSATFLAHVPRKRLSPLITPVASRYVTETRMHTSD